MFQQLVLFAIVYADILLTTSATHFECSADEVSCLFSDGNSSERNRTKELDCCNQTVDNYYLNWDRGSHYLSTYLRTLKTWECPQFEIECEKETFAYTDFTQLLYNAFCKETELEERCFAEVANVVNIQTQNQVSWVNLTQNLDVLQISDEDLLNPCIQVAMLNTDPTGFGHFHEIINPLAPLCDFVWCGFADDIIETREISMWTCMPSRCHANIIVIGVVCGLLAIATTICNAIVLVVFGTNKNQMNSSTVYKMSIALADFLVGIFVFPTFISTMVTTLMERRVLGEVRNVTAVLATGNTSNGLMNASFDEIHEPTGGLFCDRVEQPYLDAVGFFTTLSLSVSLYSLAAASIDRFIAVYRPMKYQHYAPASTARKVVLGIWILAILFSSLPFYVDSLRYRLISSIFAASGGTDALVVYLFAFALPLLTMWALSLATYCAFRIHNHRNAALKSSDHNRTCALEMKLARTLGIMVGIFTLCLLPVAIVLIIPFFLPGVSNFDPENLNPQKSSAITTLEVIVIVLLTTNSLWNFFIYSARDKRFWEATKELATKIKRPLPKHAPTTVFTYMKTISSHRKTSQAVTISASSHSRSTNPSSTAEIKEAQSSV